MRKASIAILIVVILAGALFVALYWRHRVQLHARHHFHQQTITGIGVEMMAFKKHVKIMGVLPGTPAAKAGLHPGLIIDQIDGADIAGKPLTECVAMMRGPVGSTVQLEVIDPTNHETNIMEFTREKISLPVIHAPMRPAPATP